MKPDLIGRLNLTRFKLFLPYGPLLHVLSVSFEFSLKSEKDKSVSSHTLKSTRIHNLHVKTPSFKWMKKDPIPLLDASEITHG